VRNIERGRGLRTWHVHKGWTVDAGGLTIFHCRNAEQASERVKSEQTCMYREKSENS